jgi:LysM repeat protein
MLESVGSVSKAQSASPAQSGGKDYRIKLGDTLGDIAKRNGVSVDVLAKANGITNPNKIFAGQTITIPTGGKTQTVERGDTLTKIAAENNTTVDALMKANPEIRNANQIYPGQVVRIAGAEARPAPKAAPRVQNPQAPVAKAPIAKAPEGKAPVAPTDPRAPTAKDDVLTKLGNALATGEGNYESYNTGTKGVKGGKVGHSYISPDAGTVTNKTINEILATASKSGYDKGRMFATGKYQTTLDTLAAAKKKMGLTGNEKYTPEMQERVFREFLVDKAGGGKLAAFINKGEGTIDTAQYAAAKEWASIAVPAGLRIGKYNPVTKQYEPTGPISNGRMSYYEKPGQNSASAKATSALRDALSNIDRSPAAPGKTPASAEKPAPAAKGTIDGNAEARRNGIAVKAPSVKLSNLDANMKPVFAAVAQAAKELGLPNPVVTSGNDSKHKVGSLHYQNKALDFRGNNITLAQGQRLEDRVKELLGGKFDVDFEVFPKKPLNNHLHVEFDPN